MASLTGASRPSPNSTIPTKRISVRGLDSPTARTSGDIKPYSAAALASFMIGRSALCIPTCARTLPSLRKRAFAASSTQGQSSVLRQVPIFNMRWVAADWPTVIPLIQILLSAWLPTEPSCGNPACTSVTKVDVFGALTNEPTPYVYVYSLQTQLEPFHNLQVTVGYQGSRSRKLVRTIDLNRFHPGDTFDPCNPPQVGKTCGNVDGVQSASPDGVPCGASNPACPAPVIVGNNRFGRVFIPLPDVNASFDAGIFEVTRRFSHGLTLSSVYTLSHSIDTSSYEIGFQQTDPSNQLLNKGSSDYDVRHHWQLSGYWELPILSNRHDFLGRAFGGWTLGGILDKHSGFPFTALIGSCDTNNDRNGDGTCPDLPAAYSGGIVKNPSKLQWINGVFPSPSTEFDVTTRGPGCRCRYIFVGPCYTGFDASIGKIFAFPNTRFLGEGAKLEFRANLFNVFNILNLQP